MNTFVSIPFWSAEKCDAIVERVGKTAGHEVLTSVKGETPVVDKSVRQADMHGMNDSSVNDEILEWVLSNNEWGFELGGGLPSVEVLHYVEGGFQQAHTDWGGTHNKRKLSFSIQLSPPASYEGGELILHDGPRPWMADMTQGSITLFPSWTLHSVQEVTAGERWSAVGWLLGGSSYV
ncbi:MAG: 2OG-Fe(II) oxygenase [Anaerolineales bacterium]|nr:2OG-Fe(II) oxygenase [Anaerolineales bacterium]